MAQRKMIEAAITLTKRAGKRLNFLLKQKNDVYGLKLGVKSRGCNGLSYTMNYCQSKQDLHPLDEIVEEHGVRVIIDNKAVFFLLGTKMDYKEDAIASEFIFENPNSVSECGCGESFNIKQPNSNNNNDTNS